MPVNRSIAARILRVNHGGEHGAISIYSMQIVAARVRAPDLLPFLQEALAHERSHRERFRALMPSRASKPCRLMWIWAGGGALLGLVTGVLGREAILACTEAVEATVHRHLEEQVQWARHRDDELRQAIETIQAEENAHLDYALKERRRPGLRWLHAAVSAATEALIFISTRGDSRRLAADLALEAGP